MDERELFLFNGHLAVLPLYEAFRERLLADAADVEVRVQKTQISFYRYRMFACVSFAKVRRKAERPEDYIVVTFGLGRRVDSPRIDAAAEPYPGRWTHHVTLADPIEIDGDLMGWLREAAAFAASKR